MICIGYAGCEAFDIVLYLGRTLTKLNYRLLIIDISNSGALFQAIRHGMDLDSSQDIINYRDINYTRRMPSETELNAFNDGVVFLVYGRNEVIPSLVACNELNVIVNTLPNTIESINQQILNAELPTEKLRLLIRDVITPDDIDRVKEEVKFSYETEGENYLYLDMQDYEAAVRCQVTKLIRFLHISSGMKRYIQEELHRILPELSRRRIKKALASAGKGR